MTFQIRSASNDQREDLSVLISTFQTKQADFEEVRSDIQSTAAEIDGIRQGVTSIQQQTDTIQVSTSQISSTLAKGFENLETHQQNCLLKLSAQFEELYNKLSHGQSSGASRSAEMQNSVSENNF